MKDYKNVVVKEPLHLKEYFYGACFAIVFCAIIFF